MKKTGATQVQHKQSQSESQCDTTDALSWPLFSLLFSGAVRKIENDKVVHAAKSGLQTDSFSSKSPANQS